MDPLPHHVVINLLNYFDGDIRDVFDGHSGQFLGSCNNWSVRLVPLMQMLLTIVPFNPAHKSTNLTKELLRMLFLRVGRYNNNILGNRRSNFHPGYDEPHFLEVPLPW